MMFVMPPGKYFVGDPCYAFDSSWSKILDESQYLNLPYRREDGVPVICAFSTAHGDGLYCDRENNSYAVDAGLIGIVLCGEEDHDPHSRVVEFKNFIKCFVKEAGHTITFDSGDMRIEIQTEADGEDTDA